MRQVLVIFRLINKKKVLMKTTENRANEILDNITDPQFEDVISIYFQEVRNG